MLRTAVITISRQTLGHNGDAHWSLNFTLVKNRSICSFKHNRSTLKPSPGDAVVMNRLARAFIASGIVGVIGLIICLSPA
ncbi:MAG: hypothetical protein QNJ01_15055, partial [Desulfobacterales bacterium]|nr:hypothetical protein [Desulfobacterales bacterium]